MKSNRRRYMLVVAIAALLGGGALLAANPPAQGPMAFASYDANGDGRVSPDEFYNARNARIAERAKAGYMMRNLGNAPAFEELDGDGDGYLSELELLRGQNAHMQQHRGRQGGAMRGPGQGGMRGAGRQASFADFDGNGDGVVTEDEFNQTRGARQAASAERGSMMRNAASAPSFRSFDRNGDGQLTPDEFVPGNRMAQ
ncbi:MAG: EF-hand domain-containing protein [Sedimenticola sp.]|nr:EF-hand domain-containing protein [Sedimenticola sp.]